MEQIKLGDSGLECSRIGLGTWAIGGWQWGGTDEGQAIATIYAAIDHGITLIDTAPIYGLGRAEELCGNALASGHLREHVLIATKCGLSWDGKQVYRDSRPSTLRRELEQSLRRLRTEVIDVYQVHWPDLQTPIDETAVTLEAFRREGKIRAIGVSNCSPEQMDAFRAVAPLASVQPPYNLFERDIERDVLPYATHEGLAVLAYGALCRGLLSGRLGPETRFGDDEIRHVDPKFHGRRYQQYLAAVEDLRALARQRFSVSVLALAVRWVLDQGASVALWGARRPEQLDPIGAMEGWQLDDDARAAIDDILIRHIPDPLAPSFLEPPRIRSPP